MNTKNSQNTQTIASEVQGVVVTQIEPVTSLVGTIRSEANDARRGIGLAKTFLLAEAGVIRLRAELPGGTHSGDASERALPIPQSSTEYSYSTNDGRSDLLNEALSGAIDNPIADPIFLCGDYYLPLSINFSISASKILDDSQLVDGISVTQRVNKRPKEVSVSFTVERSDAESDAVTNIDALTIRRVEGIGAALSPVYKLNGFLQELYDNDEVFQIKNTVLNNEFGISWAILSQYNFRPSVGTTTGVFNMTLREVNVFDPLLYVEDNNAPQYNSIPTSK